MNRCTIYDIAANSGLSLIPQHREPADTPDDGNTNTLPEPRPERQRRRQERTRSAAEGRRAQPASRRASSGRACKTRKVLAADARSRALTPAIELPNRALDVYEVADILDCCAATVRREANRGRLRGTKVGSRWRFQPDDIAAYLDGETPASTAERTAWDAYVRKVVADSAAAAPRADRRAERAVRLGARQGRR